MLNLGMELLRISHGIGSLTRIKQIHVTVGITIVVTIKLPSSLRGRAAFACMIKEKIRHFSIPLYTITQEMSASFSGTEKVNKYYITILQYDLDQARCISTAAIEKTKILINGLDLIFRRPAI